MSEIMDSRVIIIVAVTVCRIFSR